MYNNETMERECKKLFPHYPSKHWDKIRTDFYIKHGFLNSSGEKSVHNTSCCLSSERV